MLSYPAAYPAAFRAGHKKDLTKTRNYTWKALGSHSTFSYFSFQFEWGVAWNPNPISGQNDSSYRNDYYIALWKHSSPVVLPTTHRSFPSIRIHPFSRPSRQCDTLSKQSAAPQMSSSAILLAFKHFLKSSWRWTNAPWNRWDVAWQYFVQFVGAHDFLLWLLKGNLQLFVVTSCRCPVWIHHHYYLDQTEVHHPDFQSMERIQKSRKVCHHLMTHQIELMMIAECSHHYQQNHCFLHTSFLTTRKMKKCWSIVVVTILNFIVIHFCISIIVIHLFSKIIYSNDCIKVQKWMVGCGKISFPSVQSSPRFQPFVTVTD